MHGIKELDILGGAFNNLLWRTQEHMEPQTEVESEQVKFEFEFGGKSTVTHHGYKRSQ